MARYTEDPIFKYIVYRMIMKNYKKRRKKYMCVCVCVCVCVWGGGGGGGGECRNEACYFHKQLQLPALQHKVPD